MSILRPVSGGIAVTFHGVRGSTPCAGPSSRATAATRRASCSRPTTSRRSSSTSVPACARTGSTLRRASFHGTALLSHLHWDHVQGLPFFVPLHIAGRDARRLRPAPGRGPARRRVRADDAAAVLPDPADRSRRATSASTTPPTTTSRSGSPRCGRGGCATSARRSGFRVEWNGMSVAYLPDHGPGTVVDRRRRLRPARGARAVRRRRPAHPRRAAHARGVRAEAALGSLHRRLRGARRARGRRRAASCCSITTRCTATTTWIASARDARELAARMGVPELIVARDGMRAAARGAPVGSARPRARDEPVGTAPARSRRRDLPHRARSLRDRRRARHRVRRRRAGRHGVQLVHVGVARAAARVVLRGEVVDDVAAHPGRGQVGGELPRRGRRGDLPAVRAEGRRPLRARRVHARAHRRADPRRRARVRRLRDDRRARRRRPPDRRRAGASSSATGTRASRCSSTAAGTAGSRADVEHA